MPVINNQVSIPATSINSNIIAGSIWEFADRNYWGRLAMTGDAAFSVLVTVQAGQRTHLEESKISGQNRPPILPDDTLIPDHHQGAQHERRGDHRFLQPAP